MVIPFSLYLFMIDFNLLYQILKENNSFLISTHTNPDADAIGSEVAFYLVLKKLGKHAYVINHSSIPYFLEFLDTEKNNFKSLMTRNICSFLVELMF